MTKMGKRHSMGRRVRIAVVVAGAAMTLGAFATSAGAVPQGPAGDAFYDATNAQLKGPHGKLIFARDGGSKPGGPKVKTVLYKSIDAKGNPVEVSGTVVIPNKKAPKGGFPLITWAHGTTGLADACAPSRFLESDLSEDYIAYQNASIKLWLSKGYAVAMTDYQGLGTPGLHQYLIGLSEGRAVLDIVPAARKAFQGKIRNKYAIAGHSQGGHAALWATKLAKQWLPKSKLVGTAAFAPASQITVQAHNINVYSTPNGISGLAVQIIKGASTQMSPSDDITTKLNSRLLDPNDSGLAIDGQSFWDAIESKCSGQLGQVAAAAAPNGIAPADILGSYDADTAPTDNVFDDLVVRALDDVFVANEPFFSNVKTPVWIPHGDQDGTVLPALTDNLKAGAPGKFLPFNGLTWILNRPSRNNKPVVYQSYPGLDHTGVVTDSGVEDDFLAKLKAWF